MLTLLSESVSIALILFGLGCAVVGFFLGHTVKAERAWQDWTTARADQAQRHASRLDVPAVSPPPAPRPGPYPTGDAGLPHQRAPHQRAPHRATDRVPQAVP